jgi:hypothetical protein
MMYIFLGRGDGDELELRDADNFREFKVTADGERDADRLAAAITPIGRMDGLDHVWLKPDGVAALSGARPSDPAWEKSFAGMLEHAAGHGWVDERGAVRAHVEWRAA